MRDPARIARVLEKLRALWLTYPDMRLGQLLLNLAKDEEDELSALWHREDEAWEERVDHATKQGF